MRKTAFILNLLLIFSLLFIAAPVRAVTAVSGALTKNTIWTKTGSPYTIVKTIEIPKKYTLTIEPGVRVELPTAFDMFEIKGRLIAVGTEAEPIVFDGGGNSRFISAFGSDSVAFAELENIEVKNIKDFWYYGNGAFSLKNSYIENSNKASLLKTISRDVLIEGNEFRGFAGFEIDLAAGKGVEIKNNLFNGKNETAANDSFIKILESFDGAAVNIENNTFLPKDGVVIRLDEGKMPPVTVANNYWGTLDLNVIAGMVYDKADNEMLDLNLEIEPILSVQNEGTPALARPAVPEIGVYAAATVEETITITGTRAAGTAILVDGEIGVAAGEDEDWSLTLNLNLGLNELAFSSGNDLGLESSAIIISVERLANAIGACEIYTYSDWGVCSGGIQARTVISAQPDDCIRAGAMLTQACNLAVADDFLTKEKALVKIIDTKLRDRLKGRILLQVEGAGEAWYLNPDNGLRYYLGRPSDAFSVMRGLGLGATHEFITTHTIYPAYVAGKILIDVGDKGKAYYINPIDKKAYYLGRPADAFKVMREQSLGISNKDIRQIGIGEL